MLKVERLVNELMSSNSFVISDLYSGDCIVVDPGSEKCTDLIEYLDINHLVPKYIILTHEHTDHTWGCNTLIEKYGAEVICSDECKKSLSKESQAYFQFYYDDPNYSYEVKRVDYTIEAIGNQLRWREYIITFMHTPGHSAGSICFSVDNYLFTGDTIMNYKSVIPKRGGSKALYEQSVNHILSTYFPETIVCPGHGDIFILKDYIND